MRRKFLIIVLVLAVLIVVIAGTAWFLLGNENFLKSQLSGIVLKQTGRELTVSGPLRLDIGRETRIEAQGIRFQNADWAESPEMVSIGRLQVSIDIPSLWAETIIIPSLTLEECRIELLKNDAGEANWDVLPESEPPAEPPPPRTSLPVHLLDARIRNCQLEFDRPQRKRPLSLVVESLGLLIRDNIHVSLEGAGSINEEPLSLSGWYEPLGAFYLGGPLQHELEVVLGEISLQSSGTLEDTADFSGANVSARLAGPDIAGILEHAGVPPFSEGEFDFRVDLNAEEQMTQLEVNGDLGSIQARAEGELDSLRKPSRGSINTTLEVENLQAIGQAFGIDGLVAESFNLKADASFEKDIIHIDAAKLGNASDQLDVAGHIGTAGGLADSSLLISLKSEEIGRWAPALGQPAMSVGALTVDGELNSGPDGKFSLESKLLHGESVLQVTGDIGQLKGALSPELKIDFQSNNPQPLAALLGRPQFPSVPLSISGLVSKQEKRIRLSDIELNLAGNTSHIDGQVDLTDQHADSSLDLTINVPNAAELGRLFGIDKLPPEPLQVKGTVKPAGKGLAIRLKDHDSGDISLDIDGLIADLQNPDKLDATFDIRLPSLRIVQFLVPDTPLPDEPFTANGHLGNSQDRLELNDIKLELAGNHATLNGHVNRAEKYSGSEVEVLINISSLSKLGALFGQADLPDEPIILNSTIKPDGNGLVFKVEDGNFGDLQLELEGDIKDLDNPLAIDAIFDIKLPSIRFLDFIVPDQPLPDLPFSASGHLVNEQVRTRLSEVQIVLGRMTGSVDGHIGADESLSLAIQAQAPDASPLSGIVGLPLPAEPLSVKTQLSGTFRELSFTDMDTRLGQSDISGQLNIGLGDVTKISGRLDSKNLDLSWWVPEEEPVEEVSAAQPAEWVFDETPVGNLEDYGVEIDLQLALANLDLGNTVIQEFEFGVLLDSDHFELNPFSLRGTTGGNISGTVLLDESGSRPKMNINIHGKELRLGLFALEGQEISSYPEIAIDLELDGRGKTSRELASSLNGSARVFVGSGQIASSGLSFFMGDFITELFALLNPFAKTSEYTNLECGVVAADVTSGQATIFPVIVHTEQMTILSKGTIDLKTENLDLSFNTKVRKGLGLSAGMVINPLIKVGGRLATPAIELDPAGAVVKGGLAVATVGLSLVAKSMSDRFLSSDDPCGDARKEIDKRQSESR